MPFLGLPFLGVAPKNFLKGAKGFLVGLLENLLFNNSPLFGPPPLPEKLFVGLLEKLLFLGLSENLLLGLLVNLFF